MLEGLLTILDVGTLTVPVGAGLRVVWPEGLRPTDPTSAATSR